ncbi:MAG TPA: hypothetical protein VHV08_16870 [Pirellulales bacterium]|nr:hypothetical protein [Pirellulales bacterium]
MLYSLCAVLLAGVYLLALGGCAAMPYRYGQFHSQDAQATPEVVIAYGQPNKTLDRLGWLCGLPTRILPMNFKINSHDLSPETVEKLTAYLQRNDLTDVYVYVNHYDPASQWQRLKENKRISPVWRYTAGVFSLAGYTLLPGRVLGGDQYNPFTNSLYLNSDVPAVVLDEAAVAKDIHSRKYPGSYTVVHDLPLISIFQQTRAVSDVLGYAREQEDWEVEREAYRVLYPRLAIESATLGSPFLSVWWGGPILGAGGAAIGHVAGREVAARRGLEREQLAKAKPLPVNSSATVQQASYVEIDTAEPRSEVSRSERLPPVDTSNR